MLLEDLNSKLWYVIQQLYHFLCLADVVLFIVTDEQPVKLKEGVHDVAIWWPYW